MKLNFKKFGKGEPVIILHGLLGLSDNWVPVAKSLSEKYTVILPDLRNHGLSPHDTLHTYDLMCDDISKLKSYLFLDNVSIVGHSMGGKTAMVFADKYPEMIKKLIVIDISPLAYDKRNLNEVKANHFELLKFMDEFKLSEMKSRNDIADKFNKQFNYEFVTQLLLKNVKRTADKKFAWKVNTKALLNNLPEIGKKLSFSEKTGEIDTLFIFGKDSPYFSEEDYFSVKQNFPNSVIKVLRDAGHNIHIDKRDSLIRLINHFLDS